MGCSLTTLLSATRLARPAPRPSPYRRSATCRDAVKGRRRRRAGRACPSTASQVTWLLCTSQLLQSSVTRTRKDPSNQGQRFLKYLQSADQVPVYDSEHTQIGVLRRDDFRNLTICPITLDPFTELAAQVQHLRKIGVDVGLDPVWAISIDDLRVFSDVFDNPLSFLHFVEQRMAAFKTEVIQLEDELDHLGMYLKHNHYVTYATEKR